jgi:RNA polymerase sigma-70 factor (ECF subfamily)
MRGEAFERLYDEHARGLLAFLAYRVDTVAEAEDLVAETFERAFKRRRTFDKGKGSEKTWIYAIGVNVATDHQRRRAAERRALDRASATSAVHGEAEPDDAFARVMTRQSLKDALATLGEADRTAIALRYGADLSLAEVGTAMGVSVGAAEVRLRRALTRLREQMDGGV